MPSHDVEPIEGLISLSARRRRAFRPTRLTKIAICDLRAALTATANSQGKQFRALFDAQKDEKSKADLRVEEIRVALTKLDDKFGDGKPESVVEV
ncbi:hypothetical protein [Terrarubrum flagellatum]|uniref:hypothetical protein n=1 Tax=Terrirubrum flagellatum TaxID=2895980 RepID=UPI0031453778